MTPTDQSYCEIPLTQGFVALVSIEDYERVIAIKWWAQNNHRGNIYARGLLGRHKAVLLHRFILPDVPIIDHRNGNGLDCRRENLRAVPTMGHNTANQPARNRTGFKGVYIRRDRDGQDHGFAAMISTDGRRSRYLGYRRTAEEAAKLYDTAARAKWGEFAQVNFP